MAKARKRKAAAKKNVSRKSKRAGKAGRPARKKKTVASKPAMRKRPSAKATAPRGKSAAGGSGAVPAATGPVVLPGAWPFPMDDKL